MAPVFSKMLLKMAFTASMSVKYPIGRAAGFALNEADACREQIVPKPQAAARDADLDPKNNHRLRTHAGSAITKLNREIQTSVFGN